MKADFRNPALMTRSHWRNSRGLTLWELLLAMSLAAAVATGVLWTVVTTYRVGGQLTETNETKEAQVALDLLADDLMAAVSQWDGQVWLEASSRMVADDGKLRLVTRSADGQIVPVRWFIQSRALTTGGNSATSITSSELWREAGRAHSLLTRGAVGELAGGGEFPLEESGFVAANVSSLTFHWRGSDGEDLSDLPVRFPQAEAQPAWPTGVEIELSLVSPSSSEEKEPPMILRRRVELLACPW